VKFLFAFKGFSKLYLGCLLIMLQYFCHVSFHGYSVCPCFYELWYYKRWQKMGSARKTI